MAEVVAVPEVRVSWLLPVRDEVRWLGEAVDSALTQCASAVVDEVVVVDDGSSDPDAVRRALPDDPRVVLLRTPPQGIASALEHGRVRCRGGFIARLDADDVALPGRIDAQLAALRADPRLAAVGGRAQITAVPGAFPDRGPGEVPPGMQRYVDWVNGLSTPAELRRALLIEAPLFHPAATLRTEVLAAVGGWRTGARPEDYDLWLRLDLGGWRLANLPVEVVRLRDHAQRATRTLPEYARAAFLRCKQEWVSAALAPAGRRVVVWGAGRTGRPWIRWLLEQGAEVPAVVDIGGGTSRQGRPIVPPMALPELPCELLLVAVGARGARDRIRQRLGVLRPDLNEGRTWWAVA